MKITNNNAKVVFFPYYYGCIPKSRTKGKWSKVFSENIPRGGFPSIVNITPSTQTYFYFQIRQKRKILIYQDFRGEESYKWYYSPFEKIEIPPEVGQIYFTRLTNPNARIDTHSKGNVSIEDSLKIKVAKYPDNSIEIFPVVEISSSEWYWEVWTYNEIT